MLRPVVQLSNHIFRRVYRYSWPRSSIKMDFVSVRKVTGEERLRISFQFGVEGKEPRLYNLDRLQTETLDKTLQRIQANVSKTLNKKKKKKKTQNSDSEKDDEEKLIDVFLCQNGVKVDDQVLNSETWQDGAALNVGSQQMNVRVNPPAVLDINLPKVLLSGFSVFPTVDIEFTDLNQCKFVWYRGKQSEGECAASGTTATDTKSARTDQATSKNIDDYEWEYIHSGFHYLPSNEDIGYKLKLNCIPGKGMELGLPVEMVTKTTVEAGPGLCPFENRHQHTQSRAGQGSFRIMSYNILADVYADSDFSRENLFPYCPPYALDISYRKQLFVKEIQGYNCDIFCLQEVDRKVFLKDLLPTFDMEGYEGLLRVKAGEVLEGTATFFKRDKFRLVERHDVVLLDKIKEDHRDLWEKCCSKEAFKEKMDGRTSTLQVTVLETLEEPRLKLVLGTTHMYFHPRAPHVRVIQAFLSARHLEDVRALYTDQEVPGSTPAVIFCGDFNCYPEGGVHELLQKKHIRANHADWFAGGRAEFLEDMSLSHGLDLFSAAGFPRYTNYVTGFSGCLDYIYADRKLLKTASVVPMATHEEVTRYTALPNVVFPSDHLAVVCDLAWT